MTDLLNMVTLVGAAAGSLAFGVLAAYGIFRIAFGLMKPQSPALPVKASPETASIV
jgi:hypothetical protein